MGDVTLDEVFEPLSDLEYPAGKEDVVGHAEQRGASEEVLRALRALPLGDYASRAELTRSLDTAEGGAGEGPALSSRAWAHPGRRRVGVGW